MINVTKNLGMLLLAIYLILVGIMALVSGIVIPREETAVRPERPGLKVAEILADAGDTVTSGQALARLTLPEGGSTVVRAPVAGLISSSSAVIGAVASAKGEALFSIIARSEFDLVGLVPSDALFFDSALSESRREKCQRQRHNSVSQELLH